MAWTCFLDEPSFLHPALIWVWCLLCPIRAFLNRKGNSQLRDDAICSFFLMGLFYMHPVSKFETVAFISMTKKPSKTQTISCGGCKPGFISSEDTWTLEGALWAVGDRKWPQSIPKLSTNCEYILLFFSCFVLHPVSWFGGSQDTIHPLNRTSKLI